MLLFCLIFASSVALDAGELLELQHIRSIVSTLNGGDLTGMRVHWQTGDLSDACTFDAIQCDEDGHIDTFDTDKIFITSSFNQLIDASQIDFRNFPYLLVLLLQNRQMTGSFALKFPPSLVFLRIIGTLSSSFYGGYTMVGTFPLAVFSGLSNLAQLWIIDFPKLTGNFPAAGALGGLTSVIVRNVGLTGPFPNIPFNGAATPLDISFQNTKLSGAVPSSYCIGLSPVPIGDAFTIGVLFVDNPNLTELPECFKTCLIQPVASFCLFASNNLCDIGQPEHEDVALDMSSNGVFTDGCAAASGNPCTIERDSYLCLDCSGSPDSGYTYDDCGVCNRVGDVDRNSCLDCLGVPHGTNIYDICDVCMGDANTCYDCNGVAAGNAVLDLCGVCNGDGSTCDCAGVTDGPAILDLCGVCNGVDACLDCNDVPFGTSVYDVCDVCDGNSDTCYDCAGVPGGTKQYDLCDECGGDGSNCDCNGVHLGFAVLDQCGVCGGDSTSCMDCAGVPNGSATYDVCDVCNGTDHIGGCENPPDDHPLIQSAERTSTFVLLIIVGSLTTICVVAAIILAFTLRRRGAPTDETVSVLPPKQRAVYRPIGARPTWSLTIMTLLAVSVPVHCVLPQTTEFLQSIAIHTNIESVYPEWFDGPNMRQFCSPAMVGLTCVGQDIASVHLDRPLNGIYNPDETQLVALLPVATSFAIVDSPLLKFHLDGVGFSQLLERIAIVNSGLRGTLPTDIAAAQALTSLEISHTHLEGVLPMQLGELTLLKNLTISHSRIVDVSLVPYDNLNGVAVLDFRSNDIAHSLVSSIGSMAMLTELELANNEFVGTIPATFVDLQSLTKLNVANNRLVDANSGLFSGLSGALQDSLETLMLDDNDFGPELPNLGGYHKLRHIGLSHNEFSSDFTGLDGFYYGETGAIVLTVLANDNKFTKLRNFGTPLTFYGVCNFTNNNLCTDSTDIEVMYFVSDCDLGLKPHECAPAACGDTSCLDCTGTPNGMASYDLCDVCAGSSTTCLDCAGVVNGPATYDICSVCDGDGSSCLDCAGEPNGPLYYDGCDVCGGDNLSCADCAGVPFGSSTYDVCGVCNGRGHTCLDCLGVLNGTALFDECGVCNGDGLSCADPLVIDYIANSGSFALFVLLAIVLAILVLLAGLLLYLICSRI